jgi:hypothetical protein
MRKHYPLRLEDRRSQPAVVVVKRESWTGGVLAVPPPGTVGDVLLNTLARQVAAQSKVAALGHGRQSVWNGLVDQLRTVTSIGLRDWAHG